MVTVGGACSYADGGAAGTIVLVPCKLGMGETQLTHTWEGASHPMSVSRVSSSGHLMFLLIKKNILYSFQYHTILNFSQFLNYNLYYLCYSL